MAATGAAHITAIGARAALGLNSLQVAMGVHAGLFEPQACALKDARGRAAGMCRVGGIGERVFGYERLLALAVPALAEAGFERDLSDFELVLALPSRARPDDDPRLDTMFADALIAAAGRGVSRGHVFRSGHAGGIAAMRQAMERLEQGARGVIVGGVDTYYHPEAVRWLDDGYRLHAIEVEDGMVPGEGAAFVVLEKSHAAALATLTVADVVDEPALLDEARPNLAEGLTGLAARAQAREAQWVLHDVNGEHRRQREWSMVALRHDLQRGTVTRLPDELGDLGAATAPTMATIAARWWRAGIAPAQKALLLASSDTAERGLAMLEAPS